jgi:hypothetical protein
MNKTAIGGSLVRGSLFATVTRVGFLTASVDSTIHGFDDE